MTFSLAQFGDFFTDMALNINVSAANAVASALPATIPDDDGVIATDTLYDNRSIVLPDGKSMYRFDTQQNIVRSFEFMNAFYTASGKAYLPSESVADYVYYCDFPGERMIRTVQFEINGNPLDDYDTYSYVFYRNFKLKEDKKVGYYRSVGQEVPIQGYSHNFQDGARYGGLIFNGLQTPKSEQPTFQIWQKLLFWFNLDFSLALPSAAIPFGQRFINIGLEQAEKLLFRAPAVYQLVKVKNEFMRPATSFQLQSNGQYQVSGYSEANLINSWYEYYQLPVYTNGAINYPTIRDMSLYVNNIFTHPSIHDLYIKRIGFYLVRVHRRQR